MFHVYAIYNQITDKIYIGHTENLENRIARHNGELANKKTSYTKKNKGEGKWEIIHKEKFDTRSEAMKREKQLKSYQGRKYIKSLI